MFSDFDDKSLRYPYAHAHLSVYLCAASRRLASILLTMAVIIATQYGLILQNTGTNAELLKCAPTLTTEINLKSNI